MRNARKSLLSPVLLLLLALAVLPAGCASEDDGLDVLVSPNPVVGVVQGDLKRWDFVVTLANRTEHAMTITGYYGEVINTDGCVDLRALHTNRPYTGVTIPPGGVFAYDAGFFETCFTRGDNVRSYQAVTDDGGTVSGSVLIYLR